MRVDLALEPGQTGWISKFNRDYALHTVHSHAELECNLVRRGTASYLVDDQVIELAPGDCIWLHPEHEHLLLNPSPDFSTWILVLATTALPDLARQIPGGSLLVDPRPPLKAIARRLPLTEREPCEGLLNDVFQSGPRGNAWMNAAMPWAFARLWRAFQAAPQSLRHTLHPGIAQARRLLHANPEEWGRDELAAQSGLSKAHFSRLFADEIGMSLTAYRNHLRLVRAIDLMRQTKQELVAIAFAAGFGSYPQFHRVFVAAIGVTPAAWRRAN